MVAPLVLAAGVQAGGALLGGLLQSNAANKAADRQAAAEQAAQQARERAAQKTQQLQAPGVAAYGAGLNALTGRLGLPTQGIAPTQTVGGAFDPAAYLAANPDVAAEFSRLSPNNLKNNLGVSTPEQFAQWHYNQYGQYEGRPGSPSQAVQTPAEPAPTAAAPAAGGTPNALTGSFGNTADPAWVEPEAFSFNINDFVDNPAYKFAQEQGSGQVLASSAATGALQSGAALKALQDRGQKTAYGFYDQERDAAYDQWLNGYKLKRANYESDRGYLTDRYDRGTDDLFRYTGIGQNALNTTTNSINGVGAAEAAGLENIGQYGAGNALAQGNIWSGIAGDLAGLGAGLITGGGSGSAKNKNSRV